MIRVDLEKANIPYEVDGEVFDFHALRHTFITNLANFGVHPKDAQILARDSDIKLTMDYYTRTHGQRPGAGSRQQTAAGGLHRTLAV